MKINKYVSVLGIATSLALVNCDDSDPEVLLTDCQLTTSVFENAGTLSEEEVTICGTSAADLQEKLEDLEANNARLIEEFGAPVDEEEPDAPDPINIPAGQPAAATGASTLTFDEMVDFTFAEGNSSNTFSNAQTSIVAEVTPGDEPAATPNQALEVEITPSTLNDAGDADQGFYFAGTTFELDNLGVDLVDFTGSNKVVTANVYSDVAVGFRIQVSTASGDPAEVQGSPAPGFKQMQHSGSGWEQIEIDFNSGVSTIFGLEGVTGGQAQALPLDGVYNRLQFQFEGLPTDVLSRIFVDNVVYNQVGGMVVVEDPMTPIESTSFIQFDEDGVDYMLGGANVFTFSNSDDPTTEEIEPTTTLSGNAVTDAPAQPDSNDTTALEVEIDTDGFGFAGIGIPLENINLDNVIFSETNKTITVSVWSDFAFTLQVSVGNGRDEADMDIIDPRPAFKTVPHSGSGWEDLVIDFSTGPLFNPFLNVEGSPEGGSEIPAAELGQILGEYNSIQFQFNGARPMGMSTFYLDNIGYN